MFTSNRNGRTLEDQLIEAVRDSTELVIASAYVSPEACESIGLREKGGNSPVRLVIGRAQQEGLPPQTLAYLRNLDAELQATGGGIRVSADGFHSKLYCVNPSSPEDRVWVGSSNLTKHGLSDWREGTVEVTSEATQRQVCEEAEELWRTGIPIRTAEVPTRIPARHPRAARPRTAADVTDQIPAEPSETDGTPGLLITLLDPRNNEVQEASGLNWWNGAGRVRDPNEALIALRAVHLPQAEVVFGSADRDTVVEAVTHDGGMLVLQIEGNGPIRNGRQKGKQITTRGDKTLLGEWILRDCLGLPPNTLVTREILEAYGRTTIGFYRLGVNTETGRPRVLMDFDPESGG